MMMQARRYPEFVAASPRGLVPALVHDGMHVNDSMVCCEYLADISIPASQLLMPADAASRAKVRAAAASVAGVPQLTVSIEWL
jgi:glutathione S-transferase